MHNPAFEEIREKLADTFRHVDTLRVGSMFTGWGVLEMVVDALTNEWNTAPSTPPDAFMEAVG